jgi:hypothetical protein
MGIGQSNRSDHIRNRFAAYNVPLPERHIDRPVVAILGYRDDVIDADVMANTVDIFDRQHDSPILNEYVFD